MPRLTKADKELLRLAAKAYSDKIHWDSVDRCYYEESDKRNNPEWNPLTNYENLYKLAKKLGIRIHFGPDYLTFSHKGVSRMISWPDEAKDDVRAIVKAASLIGLSYEH